MGHNRESGAPVGVDLPVGGIVMAVYLRSALTIIARDAKRNIWSVPGLRPGVHEDIEVGLRSVGLGPSPLRGLGWYSPIVPSHPTLACYV